MLILYDISIFMAIESEDNFASELRAANVTMQRSIGRRS
jgi:hypothetical protein